MNNFVGKISNIHTHQNISIVTLEMGQDLFLKAIVLDSGKTAPYLRNENKVHVLFKETEVILGAANTGLLSIENKIPGVITDIEQGVLLSRVTLDTSIGEVVSIISSSSMQELMLSPKKQVIAMININEISLAYD